jgi:hypothetical protein
MLLCRDWYKGIFRGEGRKDETRSTHGDRGPTSCRTGDRRSSPPKAAVGRGAMSCVDPSSSNRVPELGSESTCQRKSLIAGSINDKVAVTQAGG